MKFFIYTTFCEKYNTLLEKYWILFFLRKPGGFQWSALAWGVLEPSYACVNFSRLSIVLVDGKQDLSEVVFSALVGFWLLEKYPTFLFCENLVNFNEATLNLHTHVWIFSPLVNSVSLWQAAFEWGSV